ncbi:MAG: hypothetical protein IPL24_12785 [Bacteroidetes bacterium]|nr:hypothetical protein [Bacteroidota bacterium]
MKIAPFTHGADGKKPYHGAKDLTISPSLTMTLYKWLLRKQRKDARIYCC